MKKLKRHCDYMVNEKRIYIGTSGWVYDHWKERFYPKNLSRHKLLTYYSEQFNSVEINNTFYKLPKRKTVKNWYDNSKENFIFSVKANRYITHMKNLKDSKEPIDNLLDRISILKEKLGPILFQLPPQWHKNISRLKNFLNVLPKKNIFVMELRHSSWFDQDILNLLKEKNISLCIHDIKGEFSPQKITSEVIYIRFHGPEGSYYNKYSHKEIKIWAKKIYDWYDDNLDIYVYFNNDAQARAIENARELRKELTDKFDLKI